MSDGEYVLPERSVQILLIDFNIMSSSAKRLREMYFKVSTVSSAAGAKETMKQSNFKAQIILVDLDSVNISDPTSTMTSGLALLQQLSISSKNVPIIALSSIDDRDLRRKIIDAGAREVLTLPIHKAARDTLLKYGRLYHHLNKPLRSKSFHVSPPVKLSKKVEDPNDTFRVPGVTTHIRSLDNVAVCTSENDNEVEGGVALSALPSSLAGNTSFYSNGMYGTERTDTPNTANEHKTQMWSAHTARHVVSDGQQKHSAVGTIHFMAPEVIFDHKYGRSVDWWACGVTFYECTVRQHLFNGADKEIIMQHILSGPIDLDPLSQYSTLLQRLVAGLLVRNPVLRLGTDGAHTIMRQEFFKGIDWNTISESNPNYKPAQHVNQRHSVEDKMLFYGEVHGNKTERSRTEIGLEDYRRSASVKEGRGAPSSTGRSKKRYGKNLNMRQRKEEFQKLTDQRKSWVSGNHLLSGLEGSKKTGPYSGVGASKQASARPGGMGNPNATARSGMMNASLDWSITMLPEGDSSNSEESKGEDDEEERKEAESKSPNQEEADVQEVQQKQEQEIQHEHLEKQDKQQQEVEVVVAKVHHERGKQEKEEREEMKEQDVSHLQEQEQDQVQDGTVHVEGTNSQSICSNADVNASHGDNDDAAAECEASTCNDKGEETPHTQHIT
jgi:serine/threonine protein kinase